MATTTTDSPTDRSIDRLRAQADFLVRHRDVLDVLSYDRQAERNARLTGNEYAGADTWVSVEVWPFHIELMVCGENAKAMLDQLRRALPPGTWRKNATNWEFRLERDFAEVLVRLTATREKVCERVVVRTEPKVIPAVEAQPERTVDEEIVEWRCSPVTA